MPTEIEVRVPGDKSLTHRALLFAALATGRSRIIRPLIGADTRSTAAALRAVGVTVSETGDAVIVDGVGLHGFRAPEREIDCGNSGTTARLLMGALAGHAFASVLTGDASLCSRPMRRVTEPLSRMGATFEELGSPDRLPIRMHGGTLRPSHHDSPHASAQVKSAIMLAGLTSGVEVTVTEPTLSRDHTERMLSRLGVPLHSEVGRDGRVSITLSPVARMDAFEMEIPGDASSAAFIIAWALLAARAPIRIRDVGLNPTRTGFFDAVRCMGGSLTFENVRESCGEPIGDIVVEQSHLHGTNVAPSEVPSLIDEIPILSILASRAEGTTVIEGAGELRVKESDRITAIVSNLHRIGAAAEERPDGLIIHGKDTVAPGTVQAHGDHRIAMAFGVLAAVTGNIDIDDMSVVDVSFPGFELLLDQLSGSVAA